jgi:hypothetical protein
LKAVSGIPQNSQQYGTRYWIIAPIDHMYALIGEICEQGLIFEIVSKRRKEMLDGHLPTEVSVNVLLRLKDMLI